jgi:hypothetical protein
MWAKIGTDLTSQFVGIFNSERKLAKTEDKSGNTNAESLMDGMDNQTKMKILSLILKEL